MDGPLGVDPWGPGCSQTQNVPAQRVLSSYIKSKLKRIYQASIIENGEQNGAFEKQFKLIMLK